MVKLSIVNHTVFAILWYASGQKSQHMHVPTEIRIQKQNPLIKLRKMSTYTKFLFYSPPGRQTIPITVHTCTVSPPNKNHFLPYLSDKVGRNILPIAHPAKTAMPNPLIIIDESHVISYLVIKLFKDNWSYTISHFIFLPQKYSGTHLSYSSPSHLYLGYNNIYGKEYMYQPQVVIAATIMAYCRI